MLRAQAASSGTIPPALAARPVPVPGYQFFRDAFRTLDRSRPRGFGDGPIPWGDMVAYARDMGLDSAAAVDRFVGILTRVDDAWLTKRAELQARHDRSN